MFKRRSRDFNMIKTAALVTAILIAQALPGHSRGGDTLSTGDLIGAFSFGVFDVQDGALSGTAWVHGDGAVRVETAFGTFAGRWRPFEDQLCLMFPNGPKAGVHCVDVTALGQGRYESSDGVWLERQAIGVPVD